METIIPRLPLASLTVIKSSDATKIQKKSLRFFMEYDLLFMRGFNEAALRYIAGDEAAKVLQEVH